jgi:hypothetical protein
MEESAEEEPQKDSVAKAVSLASVTVPIAVALIAACFSIASAWVQTRTAASAAQQATDAKLLDLAVGILREEPKSDTIDIREWAADLLDKRSPDLPLPASVRAQLKTVALPGRPPVPLMTSVSIAVQPPTIRLGETVRLSWDSTNATTVTIFPIGVVESEGYRDLKPSETTLYTVTGSNSTGGYSVASVGVEVVK